MWAGNTIVWTNSNYPTRVTERETNLGCCAWIPHIVVNTAKERSGKDVACSWRQLAISSEMSQFPHGLPEGLQSQKSPHNWGPLLARMKKFYCVVCKVFHFPLHSTASLELHPSQPEIHSLSRRRPDFSSGHTLLDNRPCTDGYCFPFLLGRLGLLFFSFFLGGGIVLFSVVGDVVAVWDIM